MRNDQNNKAPLIQCDQRILPRTPLFFIRLRHTYKKKSHTHYSVFLISRLIFFNTSYKNHKNFYKKSSTRRNGEQFTIGMLESAVPHC
ncbi:hypothetical protein FUT83_14550 [Treponema phagedenis]|uniref:Uncharacterized protein n=1 Tax=Treponema phagedenis TaxID=162 RepID=A0AAE6IWK4_TREPH|nr:hypothetical protein FUT82_15900 [Treponema phagedenis]QEK04897.1 hypothetical protein FUT83_14550 [Treponema phagedenis]QEK10517.1 hypothetical protein FUT81_14465 [Treponema phagedenis]